MGLIAELMTVSEDRNQEGNLKRHLLKGSTRLMASLSGTREIISSEKL